MQHRPAVLLLALAVAACDYSAPEEVINGQAVAAVREPSSDFTQYTTFTVTDKIQVYDNTSGTPKEYTKDAPEIVAQVRKNMEARGYTYVSFSPTAAADLVIGLNAILGSQAYGGYYCGWYYWGYYPYGCSYTYYGTYNYGTLLLEMADLKNAPPESPGANLKILWGAAMYGILATQPYNLSVVLSSIDRAFEQSPYLHR